MRTVHVYTGQSRRPILRLPRASLGQKWRVDEKRVKVLGETHGHCVLERFAAQGRDARPSPDVILRGATQLRRAGHVGGGQRATRAPSRGRCVGRGGTGGRSRWRTWRTCWTGSWSWAVVRRPGLHWDRDCAMACCRPRPCCNCSWETTRHPGRRPAGVHSREKEHRLSPMAAAGQPRRRGTAVGRGEWGSKVPGVRNTLVVLLALLPLARRFWNQTCSRGNKERSEMLALRWNRCTSAFNKEG